MLITWSFGPHEAGGHGTIWVVPAPDGTPLLSTLILRRLGDDQPQRCPVRRPQILATLSQLVDQPVDPRRAPTVPGQLPRGGRRLRIRHALDDTSNGSGSLGFHPMNDGQSVTEAA
jgi:hypothetical protein